MMNKKIFNIMNGWNKNRLKFGLQVLLLFVCALLTIATCSGLWGVALIGTLENFNIVISILLMIVNTILIWTCALAGKKKYDEKRKELLHNK